jgi:hypothetical protein
MKRIILSLFCLTAVICIKAQDTTLTEYVGTYNFPEGSPVASVEVKIENGKLIGNSTAGSSVMERIAKDTFSLVTYNGTVYFLRNSQNKVDSIRIQTQDVLLEGKKQDVNTQHSLSNIESLYIYEALKVNSSNLSTVNSDCLPVASSFTLYKPDFISSSPIITTKGIDFFSAYLNCLSNFAGS